MARFRSMVPAITVKRRVGSRAAVLCLALGIGGTANTPLLSAGLGGAQDDPPSHPHFNIGRPHVARRGDGYVLVYTVDSESNKHQFWAVVDVSNPDGTRKCEWLKTIEPQQNYRFECPIDGTNGQTYASRLRVYENEELTRRVVHYTAEMHVSANALVSASNAEPAATASRAEVVPTGVLEGFEFELPVTFKPIWYRRVDRGFSLRAYEHSGDLTVAPNELLFVDGDRTIRIPFDKLQSVRWEPMPNDIANHWVIVRFTNDEGKVDAVGFRDGGRLGQRQNTGLIYQAVRRASKK